VSNSMSKADLVTSLKSMLGSAAAKFERQDEFENHLAVAAFDLGRVRERTIMGELTLVAGQMTYPAPANMILPKTPLWGLHEQQTRNHWDSNYPANLPRIFPVNGGAEQQINLIPVPTASQIADLGSRYQFHYFAAHIIDDDAAGTTINPFDRSLLLIRATAQAMQELATSQAIKPVSLSGEGITGMPKNGTPAALADQLLRLFKGMAHA